MLAELTNRQLAEQVGASLSVVSMLRSGHRRGVDHTTADAIADALDVPFDRLFALADPLTAHTDQAVALIVGDEAAS